MAKKLKSAEDVVTPSEAKGLKNPFPSSPKFTPICELKIKHTERDMLHVHTFAAWYSAKKMVDALIKDEEIKWLSDHLMEVSNGITIKSMHMNEIMEHEYTKAEAAWELPPPYPNIIRIFRGEAYKKEQMEKDIVDHVMKPVLVSKKQFEKIRDTPKAPRAPKEGMVSIADIASELKVHPRIARGILRDAKIKKPDGGWSWPKGDKAIDTIKTTLKKGMKS